MGIQGLKKLIERFAPNAYFTLPITYLSGKRIAIDASGWMYANICIARGKVIQRTNLLLEDPDPNDIRREWFLAVLNFILYWLSNNITPVFVFDGTPPPEKTNTKAERRQKRVDAKKKIDELTQLLRSNPDNRSTTMAELKRNLCNYTYIASEEFELFETVIEGIGIPCLKAMGEAEQLCSMLCYEEKVAAVFSADSDCLVYGCPLVISNRAEGITYDDEGTRVTYLKCIRLDTVLETMNISHSLFVDLCIMSGCDFNKNMKGYAALKSLDLLKKYNSIDHLPKNFDITCLNHSRCRELFKYVLSTNLIANQKCDELPSSLPIHSITNRNELPSSLPIHSITNQNELPSSLPIHSIANQNELPIDNRAHPLDVNMFALSNMGNYFHLAGISTHMNKLAIMYQHLKLPSDGHIEELKLKLVDKYVPPILLCTTYTPKYITLKVIGNF